MKVHVSEGRENPTSDFVAVTAPHTSLRDVVGITSKPPTGDDGMSSMSDMSSLSAHSARQTHKKKSANTPKRMPQRPRSFASGMHVDKTLLDIANPNKTRPFVDPPKHQTQPQAPRSESSDGMQEGDEFDEEEYDEDDEEDDQLMMQHHRAAPQYESYNNHHQPTYSNLPEQQPSMSKDELMAKLRDAERHGIKSSLDRNCSVQELHFEYDRVKQQIQTERQVKFARRMLMMTVSGMEFLNTTYDPCGVTLEGWSDQVMSSIDEYDGILERLVEKWDNRVNVAPEVELMLTLGGSAFMFHLTASMFKSAPSVGDVAKDNPELMREIAKAMAKNMTTTSAASQPSPPRVVPEPTRITPVGISIPKMSPPSIDVLSKIMPGSSSNEAGGTDNRFHQSLVETFKPNTQGATMAFDDETRIVEVEDPKPRGKAKAKTVVVVEDKKVLSLDDEE